MTDHETPGELTGTDLSGSDAFESLYDRTLPTVYGYLLRRCGGRRDVAQDLTQETFLSAVRELRSGVIVRAPLSWLMTIARRRLVDHYRRQQVRRRVDLPVEPGSIPGWGATRAEARLVSAMETMPTDQRVALVLRYVDDLSVADVAALIGRTVAATESLLARARRSLAERYEEVSDG